MANQWAAFKNLIGGEKKWIGEVILIGDANKKITVQPIGSSEQIDLSSNAGTYLVGNFVYVVGDTISGQAPQISEAYKEIIT